MPSAKAKCDDVYKRVATNAFRASQQKPVSLVELKDVRNVFNVVSINTVIDTTVTCSLVATIAPPVVLC